ncbi:MAG: FlgD immunoglobulin-like domain containing protein [Spirochaetota bacterium]
MSTKKRVVFGALLLGMCILLPSFAYDPPKGAFFLRSIYSPWGLASTPTVTGPSAPWAALLNPSATAAEQMTEVEGAYVGITDFGAAGQGWGSAASVAFSLPAPYGVWGGAVSFLHAPGTMTSMPLGTFGSVRVGFAKDLFPDLYAGSALDITMGGNGSFGWGVGLDLGLTYLAGDLGFLKDARFGLSLLDIGKGYSTSPLTGMFGGAASSYPSAFTLGLGARGYLVRSFNWNLDLGLDLWSPSFQDLEADISLGLGFRDFATLRLGWSIGLRDIIQGTGRSYLPSIGVSGVIPLGKGLTLGKSSHRDASLGIGAAAAPLYDSLYAVGAGFNLSFGLEDKTPPDISLDLPVKLRSTVTISPNGDKVNDNLVLPLKISDQRYVVEWELKVENQSKGEVVRRYGASLEQESDEGLARSLLRGLVNVKKSVRVPESVTWDGKDDQGRDVPDGSYTMSLIARDDNGNHNVNYQNFLIVNVKRELPAAQLRNYLDEDALVFSPDGDNSKEEINFGLGKHNFSGLAPNEQSWTLEIRDGTGRTVRSQKFTSESPPRDFTWDGTANDGSRVPDGRYSYQLRAGGETEARGAAEAQGAARNVLIEVNNIEVNTARPKISIDTDSLVMSPNGDGVMDLVQLRPSVESGSGLQSWKVFVLNSERREVWSVSGKGDSMPKSSYPFFGLSSRGEILADGYYEAGIELAYRNGYQPQKLSSPFLLDKTPPSASIGVAESLRVFSPDGDGRRETIRFVLESSEEENWNFILRDSSKNEKIVKKFPGRLPQDFLWDGRDDQGAKVPDGEYEVYVFAVDRAGNSFNASSPSVRVDTRKPSISLAVESEAFSPNGDGIAESVRIQPKVQSLEGLISWSFSIQGTGSAAGKGIFIGDKDGIPLDSLYLFDGKDLQGRMLPDGVYASSLSVAYLHGYEAAVEGAPVILDREYPKAEVSADLSIFNPLGKNGQTSVKISQGGTAEDSWLGQIFDSRGTLVRRWALGSRPEDLVWDGTADSGLLVPDGKYRYVVSSTDKAGNAFVSKDLALEVETSRKTAQVSSEHEAFSPNGDGVKDRNSLALSATMAEKVVEWDLRILPVLVSAEKEGEGVRLDEGSKRFKSWSGKGALLGSFVWDGKGDDGRDLPDGRYVARISVRYPNGDLAEGRTNVILVDRVYPSARLKISHSIFSPNGDGRNDSVRIEQDSQPGDAWQGRILDAKGTAMRTWSWAGVAESFDWDGKGQDGLSLPDGVYQYELVSEDQAGNRFASARYSIEIDAARKAVRLEAEQRALSPNGDGQKDELGLRASVQSQERVKGYELRIVGQEGPQALQAVRSWKGNGAVPERFVWKGEMDSGAQAQDGRYAAALRVEYTNGDVEESASGSFLMDRVFPKIEVSASLGIISPNGDGRSDVVEIAQRSVPGDDWRGKIVGPDGRVVRSYSWKGEAKGFAWDGTDEGGNVVRDGEYRYVVESTDGAENRTEHSGIRVMVETEKKVVRMDADAMAFSPNGDGVKDVLKILVRAQNPGAVKDFALSIFREGNTIPVRTWKGSSDLRSEYLWDGLTDGGIDAPDGRYRLALRVLYRNDDVHDLELGPITVDRVPPKASVRLSTQIISPNGDGRLDYVDIIQEAQPGDLWQGMISSQASGRVVRSWTWKDSLATQRWDGKNQEGQALPDGLYFYELTSSDVADNRFASPRIPIEIDAARKTVSLEIDQRAFSPNGDGIKDQLYINIQAPKAERLEEYELGVYVVGPDGRPQANPLRSWKGRKDLSGQYAWDGRADSGIAAPDGKYQVLLRLAYENGDRFALASPEFALDTSMPMISVSADPLLFSPNGDGIKDVVNFTQKSSLGDNWTGRIRNASGAVVRTWSWTNEAKNFTWDGKDASGTIARDGVYSYEVSAIDQAGHSNSARISGITVDATKPRVFVTASDTGISPNGDGIRDEVSFTLVVERREGIQSWRFSLVDTAGRERSFFGGSGSEVPARLVWDGRDLQGQVVEGEFVGSLVVTYTKGDVAKASSAPVLVDVEPPKVTVTLTPEYFSPDGDGVEDILTFDVAVDRDSGIVDWKLEIFETAIVESSNPQAVSSERLFIQWDGKGKPPAKIVWNGLSSKKELVESATDYPFRLVVRDSLGNTTTVSGIIAVDVLVIRDGDRLKIKVPSIVFRANHADFLGLSRDIVTRNEKVVARIAQILNKFPDYRIRIEGHGNNVGKMLGYSETRIQAEEAKELLPLSTGRAELVKTMLVQNGVDVRRLSVEGLGSKEPVVSFLDVENRWKNRRVEFILIKN